MLAAGPGPVAPRGTPEPRLMEPGASTGFRLPFQPGQDVTIDQGWNTYFSHNGKAAFAYDFGVFVGTPVVAAAPGVVSFVHDGETACGGPELRLHANLVIIDHPDGSATQYGHLSTVDVEVGDVVLAGQEIGLSGMTGYSQCLPHLHFARQLQGGPVTQSLPVYFKGYADRQFAFGEIIQAEAAPACPVSTTHRGIEQGKTEAPASDARVPKAAVPKAAAPGADVALTEPPLGGFCGTYFAPNFEGSAYFTRSDPFLNFDWSKGPGGYWLDDAKAGFAARWSGRFSFASSGRYTIGIVASGGVRVALDGAWIYSRWVDHAGPIEVVVTKTLGAGIHRIDVEHFTTRGHDVLKVGWGRFFPDE